MDKNVLREAQKHLSEARTLIETVRDDEQEKYDEKSETWMESESGQKAGEAIELLSEILDQIDGIEGNLDAAMS